MTRLANKRCIADAHYACNKQIRKLREERKFMNNVSSRVDIVVSFLCWDAIKGERPAIRDHACASFLFQKNAGTAVRLNRRQRRRKTRVREGRTRSFDCYTASNGYLYSAGPTLTEDCLH